MAACAVRPQGESRALHFVLEQHVGVTAAPGKGQFRGSAKARGTRLCKCVGLGEQLSYFCLIPLSLLTSIFGAYTSIRGACRT